MKRLGVMLLAAFAAAAWTQARAADPPAGVADVTKADDAFTDAILKGDASAFDVLTTKDYFLTTSLGQVREKDKNLEALKEGSIKFDKIDTEDRKFNMHGDVAIVTGLAKIKGMYKDKAFDDSYRFTRVWINHGTAWKCATEQFSRVLNPDDLKPKDGK